MMIKSAKREYTGTYAEQHYAMQTANSMLRLLIERGYAVESRDSIAEQISHNSDNWYCELRAQIENLRSRYNLHFTGSRFTIDKLDFIDYAERQIWRKIDQGKRQN